VGGRDVEVRVASGDRSRRERERLTACQRRDRLHGKPLGRATRTTGKARAFLDLSRARGRQSPSMATKPCANCRGTGRCQACGGTGKINQLPCASCNAAGRPGKCNVCRGHGQVPA
jgi:hypothetical protein